MYAIETSPASKEVATPPESSVPAASVAPQSTRSAVAIAPAPMFASPCVSRLIGPQLVAMLSVEYCVSFETRRYPRSTLPMSPADIAFTVKRRGARQFSGVHISGPVVGVTCIPFIGRPSIGSSVTVPSGCVAIVTETLVGIAPAASSYFSGTSRSATSSSMMMSEMLSCSADHAPPFALPRLASPRSDQLPPAVLPSSAAMPAAPFRPAPCVASEVSTVEVLATRSRSVTR